MRLHEGQKIILVEPLLMKYTSLFLLNPAFLMPSRVSLPLVVFTAFCCLLPAVCSAQKREAQAEHITARQMREYLTFLSDDVFEGRDTPSRGLDTAAKFIAMNLDRWGFMPAGDNGTFFQKIELTRDVMVRDKSSVTLGDKKFAAGDDFLATPVEGTASAPLVYVGVGWRILPKGIDPYKGVDVKGKIVVAEQHNFFNVPGITIQEMEGMKEGDFEDLATAAKNQGALAIVEIVPETANWEGLAGTTERTRLHPAKFRTRGHSDIPVILLKASAAKALFEGEPTSAEQIFLAMTDKKPLPSFALNPGKMLHLTIAAHP